MASVHHPRIARAPSITQWMTIFVAGLALLVAACLPELASLEDRACDADGRCAEGYVCDPAENLCVRSLVDPPDCTFDEECPGDEICVGGVCETPSEPPECTTNADCPGEEVCSGGLCRDPASICTRDTDCPGAQVCTGGLCQDPATDCTDDTDCPGVQVCSAGLCEDPPPECVIDTDCPGEEICDGGTCRDPDTPETCAEGALRACDLVTGEPVTGPACEAGLQHCRLADFTWSDCEDVDLIPPELELDGEAAGGELFLEAGESELVPVYDRFDPRAGTVAGDAFRWWVLGWPEHVTGSRTNSRIGTVGSDATVELAPGLHLVALEVTDPCGGQAVVSIRVQVEDPFDAALAGQVVDALCFTGADQAPPVAVAGTGAVARSLDANLVQVETHTRDGSPDVVSCSIGPSRTHIAWGDGTITRHLLGHFDQGGGNPNRVQVATDPGAGDIPFGGLARDGEGRVWRIRGGRLAYTDAVGLTFFEGPFSTPTDGDWEALALAYDGAGSLWVGTRAGVNRLDVSGADASSFAWTWSDDPDLVGLAGGPTEGAVTAVVASAQGVWGVSDDWPGRVMALPSNVNDPLSGDVQLVDLQAGPDLPWAPRITSPFGRLQRWGAGPNEELVLGGAGGVVRMDWTQAFSEAGVPLMWLQVLDAPSADLVAQPRDGGWHLLSATGGGVARYRGP